MVYTSLEKLTWVLHGYKIITYFTQEEKVNGMQFINNLVCLLNVDKLWRWVI